MKINNKLKAFTMAELMVLLLTLSILLAAFSPVFTTRYTNYATNDLWKFVQSDKQYDEYYYVSDASPSRVIIGITPTSETMVNDALTHKGIKQNADLSWNENAAILKDSKLILRAGEGQKQMVFLVGNQVKGSLLAGNGSIMFGGLYPSNHSGAYNTAFGIGALSNASGGTTENGGHNTALGVASLGNLTSGKNNTAIGAFSGTILTTQAGNVILGYAAASDTSGSIGSQNTIIGSRAAEKGAGSYNTFVGSNIAYTNASTGNYNTAVGYAAMNKLSSGSYNTAVGGYSMASLTTGSYNTAVGYGAGASTKLTTGSNKTFIGFTSGAGTEFIEDVLKDNEERVFIGTVPEEKLPSDKESHKAPVAVLEVHNVLTSSLPDDRMPIQNVANASVVINGNLIVRGNTYLEIPILRAKGGMKFNSDYNMYDSDSSGNSNIQQRITKGLTLHTISKSGNFNYFTGRDGFAGTRPTMDYCKDKAREHAYNNVHDSCICTIISNQHWKKDASSDTNLETRKVKYGTFKDIYFNGRPGYDKNGPVSVSTSYDWYTRPSASAFPNETGPGSLLHYSVLSPKIGELYTDVSTNKGVYSHVFFTGHTKYAGVYHPHNDSDTNGVNIKNFGPYNEYNLAHPTEGCSCCPMLNGDSCSSDRRLKNVGEKFTAGLDELKKLNIYNFTFKNDANKAPHVGVIAQDLKRVFPNAVTKGENGFYQIRWEEMFYAMINAVKDINNRVTALATRVSKDKERIANLKKDNQALNAQLDRLVTEVEALEAKRK